MYCLCFMLYALFHRNIPTELNCAFESKHRHSSRNIWSSKQAYWLGVSSAS